MTNESKYLNLNGTNHLTENPVLMYKNRAFCYGDALFETMHAYQDNVQFFSEHFNRLLNGMNILKMSIPLLFTKDFIHQEIIALLKKNRIYQGARVRLTVFRNDGGLYTPESSKISYLIEVSKLDSIKYGQQQKGLILGVFNEIKKSKNLISALKSANALLYVMAGIFKKENEFDDCVILNEADYIAETISSNIFIGKNQQIFTPPLSDGCIHGIMRDVVIDLVKKQNNPVIEKSISLEDLLAADEVFLTNAVSGIKWVLGFQDRRYFHDLSANLTIKLNEMAL